MLAELIRNGSSIRKISEVLTVITKIIPKSQEDTSDKKLQQELERLALSATHMLADIGFKRDVQMSSGEKAVWRRGPHRVIIFSPKHAAAFV